MVQQPDLEHGPTAMQYVQTTLLALILFAILAPKGAREVADSLGTSFMATSLVAIPILPATAVLVSWYGHHFAGVDWLRLYGGLYLVVLLFLSSRWHRVKEMQQAENMEADRAQAELIVDALRAMREPGDEPRLVVRLTEVLQANRQRRHSV
jgi:hypothetical protein